MTPRRYNLVCPRCGFRHFVASTDRPPAKCAMCKAEVPPDAPVIGAQDYGRPRLTESEADEFTRRAQARFFASQDRGDRT